MKSLQPLLSAFIISISTFTSTVSIADTQSEINLIAFSGSLRKESCNKKAMALLTKAITDVGAKVNVIDLAKYPMPLYDGDLEEREGLPESVKKLQALVNDSDGLLIASPEYNGGITPLLKNILDWLSRAEKNNPKSGLKIFEGKVVSIVAASPSPFGGARGLPSTSTLLSNLGLIVAPQKVTIGNCYTNFTTDGNLSDTALTEAIKKQAEATLKLAKALKSIR